MERDKGDLSASTLAFCNGIGMKRERETDRNLNWIIILGLAVPSLTGVIADKRLRHSLNEFNDMVRQAQERSVAEHRAYLIVWNDKNVVLRPEAFTRDEEAKDVAQIAMTRGEALTLSLPSALTKDPPGEWIFWLGRDRKLHFSITRRRYAA